MKKKVLVYPCGTEIGLEIHRALRYSTHYEVIGGADGYDHGQFAYEKLIENLPFIKDSSDEKDVIEFENAIAQYNIDFIYPAMDGVISVFSKYKRLFKETLIIADKDTSEICRSKRETYNVLNGVVPIPKVYNKKDDIKIFPVFIKPDRGQGSVGTKRIDSADQLDTVDFEKYVVAEYLPGKEYTIDCFTNSDGDLIYSRCRGRKRIKGGISVNAVFEDIPIFVDYARLINSRLHQKGGWFFQMKEAGDGSYKLMEVAARIAGTSAISRCAGANLPLMTVDLFNGIPINDVAINDYSIELDRALGNSYKMNLEYTTVYVDYDDTLVQNGVINTAMMKLLYQCINQGKKIVLLSKHDGDLDAELKKYRILELFDDVIHLTRDKEKKSYIVAADSIFIDDSYGERKAIKNAMSIPVFDTHMIECLLED